MTCPLPLRWLGVLLHSTQPEAELGLQGGRSSLCGMQSVHAGELIVCSRTRP